MGDTWTESDVPPMDESTVVVTGANSGLGYEASRVFAERGATVVMACRSVERGEQAALTIRDVVPDATLDVRECDLADHTSIAHFADSYASAYEDLHVLCNNAGVMAIPRSETADGFETQFGVNHLGHFALTGLLLDTLLTTPGESRVVTQSSRAHRGGTIDFADLQCEHRYGRMKVYGQSKLANLLFGYELDRRLKGRGVESVTSVVCHPGYTDTNLQINAGEASGSRVQLWAMKAANALFGQSPEMGVLPLLYAATAEDVTGGEYVGPGGLLNVRGYPTYQHSSDESYDEDVADRLWDVSEELTGVVYNFDSSSAV